MEQIEAGTFGRLELSGMSAQPLMMDPTFPGEKARFANKVLRGELSAVEAYNQVIETFFSDPACPISVLRQVRDEHQASCESLRRLIECLGDVPSEESGPWGASVAALVNVRSLFGKDEAIRTLKTGEEHGLKEYEAMLDLELSERERLIVRDVLLPRQLRHIAQLTAILAEKDAHPA
jgi:hypothetical protein